MAHPFFSTSTFPSKTVYVAYTAPGSPVSLWGEGDRGVVARQLLHGKVFICLALLLLEKQLLIVQPFKIQSSS